MLSLHAPTEGRCSFYTRLRREQCRHCEDDGANVLRRRLILSAQRIHSIGPHDTASGACNPLHKTARNAFTQDSTSSGLFVAPLPGCSQRHASPPSGYDQVTTIAFGVVTASSTLAAMAGRSHFSEVTVMLLRQRKGIASCCVLCAV